MKNYFTILIMVVLSTLSYGEEDSTCIRAITLGESRDGRPELANQIGTTHFIIHWESPTTQTYAQNAANYAEYSFQKQCTEMNWNVPPPDDNRGGDNRYDIYLVNPDYISSNNGQTWYEITSNWVYEWAPSFILIQNELPDDNTAYSGIFLINNTVFCVGSTLNEAKIIIGKNN